MSDKGFLTRIAEKISKNKTAALGVAAAGAITANQLVEDKHVPTANTSMQEYVAEHGFTKEEIHSLLEESKSENPSEQAVKVAKLHETITSSHNHSLINAFTNGMGAGLDNKEKLATINVYEESLNDMYNEERPNNYVARNSSAYYQAANLQAEFEEITRTGELPEVSTATGQVKIEDVGNYAEYLSVVEDARQNVHMIDHYKEVFTEKLEAEKEQFAENRIDRSKSIDQELGEVSYSLEI